MRAAYLAGPMRGIADFNFPYFLEVEEALQRLYPEATLFNPARRDIEVYGGMDRFRSETGDLAEIPWFDLADAMRADLDFIIHQASHIVMLPGWSASSGAQHELATARLVGVEATFWDGVALCPEPLEGDR